MRLTLATLALTLCATLGFAQKAAVQQPPPSATQAQIDAAIDRGAVFLLGVYAEQFGSKRLENQERAGQSALSLYTMIQAGVSRENPTLRRLLTHVLNQRFEHTYDASCALLARHAADGIEFRRWIEALAQQLIAWQTPAGDWSYPAGGNDLSNTQYAALGLWAAAADGVPIDKDVWSKLASTVLRYQTSSGGFSYARVDGRQGDSDATGSMTAAGVATLAICEVQLRIAGDCPRELGQELAAARSRGIEWLARNFSVSINPRAGAWHYYYLYGLGCLGALSGESKIGGHDWYDEGAALLVEAQNERGSWLNAADLTDTCFAILSLKRATAARRGPETGRAERVSFDTALRIASSGAGPVRVWIDG